MMGMADEIRRHGLALIRRGGILLPSGFLVFCREARHLPYGFAVSGQLLFLWLHSVEKVLDVAADFERLQRIGRS
jgi:hypothetical protein